MASERAPELAEVIRRSITARLLAVRTAIPAKVVAYDANKGRVDCKPLVMGWWDDEEGQRKVGPIPVVPGVPVQWPGGAGWRITFPISDGNLVIDGDTIPATVGTLFFFQASTDKWLSGKGAEVDPEIYHSHALADGLFVPELFPFGAPAPAPATDHATVGHSSGVRIHLRRDVITIGDEAGSKKLALDGDGLTASAAMSGWAGVVENAINVLAPGTFTPANQFSGALVTNPGKAGNMGEVVASASQAKGK